MYSDVFLFSFNKVFCIAGFFSLFSVKKNRQEIRFLFASKIGSENMSKSILQCKPESGSHHIYNKETISSNKDKCKIVDFK
jgi:hypothetical protein